MKRWEKIKYPLFISLTVAVLAFVRFVAYTTPGWMPIMLLSPLLGLRLFSFAVCDSDILFEVIFWLAALGCVILAAPTPQKRGCLRRFLLRPMIAAVMILGLSTSGFFDYEALSEAIHDHKKNASQREIQEFIDIADEAIWYSRPRRTRELCFPALARDFWNASLIPDASDTILIDYDSKTVGFVSYDISYYVLTEIPLKDTVTVPQTWDLKNTAALAEPGTELTIYYSYTDGQPSNGYDISCITVSLPDGRIIGTTSPSKAKSHDLNLPASDELFERIENWEERQRYD